jgi:eukaryotic-like serine/threonine-protein kinase
MTAPATKSITTLNNRYQLMELIGKGAMGRVYKARDLRLGGAIVAIKFLAQTLLNERMRKRFWTEASICAQLGQKSIHIVRVSDYDLDADDVPFYVMEYLEGYGLNEIMRGQAIPLPRFLMMTRQICQGLQMAHMGIDVEGVICPIIHRDVKPSNILITRDHSLGEFVKVLDFGISKLMMEDAGATSTYMGTMVYSSPEQMEGLELNAQSDIYSLGVMMYEMLTATLPVQAETHSFGGWLKAHLNQVPKPLKVAKPGLVVPKALEDLVMACMAKTPQERPGTIQDILRALEPIEERFSASRNLSNRIGEVLNRQAAQAAEALDLTNLASSLPNLPKLPPPTISPAEEEVTPNSPPRMTGSGVIADELLRSASWPVKEMPVAQIVFSKVMTVGKETIPTLWVMLESYEEVKKIKLSKLYNLVYKNVLCTQTPYPIALWVTAFYNHMYHDDNGPRWMPCYLDFKTRHGMEMIRLLGQKGEYQLLFFAKELPQKCAYVTTIKISDALKANLREWSVTSATWRVVGDPNESKQLAKKLLKNELEKQKIRVAEELKVQAQKKFQLGL